MKREIEFRGNSKSNGGWVIGDLIHANGKIFIVPVSHEFKVGLTDLTKLLPFEVTPESVGQFTGFISVKKKLNLINKVYEGDVFRETRDDEETYSVVMWIKERGAFYMVPVEHYEVLKDNDCQKEKEFDWLFCDAALYDFSMDIGLTKVGNIHDNPELLTK